MKRFLLLMACAAAIFFSAMPCASANSWGLKGDLLKRVSADPRWGNYYALDRQAGDAAVMHSRYHNALMVVNESQDRRLHVYTKAVYQPERDKAVKLTQTEDGFTLAYGENESYTFFVFDQKYELKEAVIGAFRLTAVMHKWEELERIDHYTATDGKENAIWRYGFSLCDFNIALFPRAVDEIRRLNFLLASLASGRNCMGWWEDFDEPGLRLSGIGKGTAPVYASPFGASSWRAAKGKAAVGLNGEMWLLFDLKNAKGEIYSCIRYHVSERTQRIGYILKTALGSHASRTSDMEEDFLAVDVRAIQDTYLTDDPDVSQYPQFKVTAGTQFTCMGLYGHDYAYVAAEVRNGKFVDGGEIVWGFVPLKALALDESSTFRSERQTDVMTALAGEWVFYAGGNMAEDELILNADGTYTGRYIHWDTAEAYQEVQGTWYVTRYNPAWNLYWNDPAYEMHLVSDSGTANVKGLTLDTDGFSLTNDEGGGGYVRVGTHADAIR